MGLLTLAYELIREDSLFVADSDELRESLKWMEQRLPIPARFARKRNVSHKETHGLSWIKSDAGEIVDRLHAMSELVRRLGYAVEILREDRPGYVVYEDDWQVVAEPFHGKRR
ncbi:hypothetical protein [Arenimonas sp.]|uniref:hypothetical protein n=1 Tax=Arenimonas sp. TaxID=1872635 RepID=UPI0039E64110